MKTVLDFSKIKALIVGDVMIDRYWWGSVERISPEAPVPVVRLENTSLIAGGAANVAANIVGLGAEPMLIGSVGCDDEGSEFEKLLIKTGINPEHILKFDNHKTTTKTRIIAHNQQVARIDQELILNYETDIENQIWSKTSKLIEKSDVVILSDYAKGFLSVNLLKRLITKCNGDGKIVLVDPKGKDFVKYKNADVITPNQKEATEAADFAGLLSGSIESSAKKILSDLNFQAVLVTRGEEGMMLCEKNKDTLFLAASARDVYDVTGAGDTVIATLALAVCANLDFAAAAELANIAAGLVVEQVGTTAVKIDNLNKAVEHLKKT